MKLMVLILSFQHQNLQCKQLVIEHGKDWIQFQQQEMFFEIISLTYSPL